MDIKDTRNIKEKIFDDCEIGEIFEYSDTIYMKISPVHDIDTKTIYNSVKINDGSLVYFHPLFNGLKEVNGVITIE